MNFDDFDMWWRERGDDEQLSQMRAQLEKALSHKASREIEYSIRWRLARLHHFAAMKNESDKNVSRHFFSLGMFEAKRANMLRKVVQSESVEANFWHAVNSLEAARLTNKIATIIVLPRATQLLSNVVRYDEKFHFAGALRVLGRIAHLKPNFLGGGAGKSLSYFQDALEVARNSTTLLYYAQALHDANHAENSAQILREIVAQRIDDEWKWEQARDREIVARLLDELKA